MGERGGMGARRREIAPLRWRERLASLFDRRRKGESGRTRRENKVSTQRTQRGAEAQGRRDWDRRPPTYRRLEAAA